MSDDRAGGPPGAAGLHPGPDGWWLAPEGAAVRPDEGLAVVADVHLGYEWARGRSGETIPAHSLRETLDALDRLARRVPLRRLIVAGDLVESRTACARTAADVRAMDAWLADRGCDWMLLQGNHDPPRRPARPRSDLVAGWTIAHGDGRLAADRLVIGHFHPTLRAAGTAAPAFVVGAGLIVLPAFSRNAAGVDVRAIALPAPVRDPGLRCVACVGDEALDFGPIGTLEARLRSAGMG
jgi:metallophosphoesterase superfamily enzyme